MKDIKIALDRGYTRFVNNIQCLLEDDLNFLRRDRQKRVFFPRHIFKMAFLQEIFIYWNLHSIAHSWLYVERAKRILLLKKGEKN